MAAVQKPRGVSGVLSDDDYWTASSASSSKVRNIFDEGVDLDTAKRFLRNQDFDDDLECEDDVINWDGSSNREEVKSARHRPPGVSQSSRSISEQKSFDSERIPTPGRRDSSALPSSSSHLTIDDAVSRPARQPTFAEISKLEAENNCLRRNLEASKVERKLSPQETINAMIMGQKFTLERYKSREEKIDLLDQAIAAHDGNAIIATLLFLRGTIKPTIFNLELMKRPVAVEHYVVYLRQQMETEAFNQLIDILGMLGRTEEAAMLKYKQAIKPVNLDHKKKSLQNCLGYFYSTSSCPLLLRDALESHFHTEPLLAFEASLISDQISLLETQLPIDSNDASLAQRRLYVFKDGERLPLLETPVISTLLYCCLYHYDEKENNLASPFAIRKQHGLTDKQFIWTSIKARGIQCKWDEVAKLFETRGWLGGTKMKSVIGFDRVVNLLTELKAPRSELNKYCNLIEGLDHRLEVGLKYRCCESVVETYKLMRDRQRLLTYEATLDHNSPEQFHAARALKDQTIKWKN